MAKTTAVKKSEQDPVTTVADVTTAPVMAVAPREDVQFRLGREAIKAAQQSFEAGVRFEAAQERLAAARSRLGQITTELKELSDSVTAAKHPIDIDMTVLYIRGLQPTIESILSTINPSLADTKDGQVKIQEMADKLVSSFVTQIELKK